MSHASRHDPRMSIVVKPDGSAVQTVEFGLREARDSGAELGTPIGVDVRVVDTGDDPTAARRTEARVEAAIASFEPDERLDAAVDVLTLGADGPGDRADALVDALDTRDLARLVLADDREVSVERLRDRLGVTRVELAPTDVPHRRLRLRHPGGARRLATVFGVTYLFYLAVGGFAGGLDLLTGAVSAGVVALSLSHVALPEEPTLSRSGRRLGRMGVILLLLLWEVVKANFVIAYLILHPRLPIDPAMEVHRTDTHGGLERMVLANSITLTPGTLTVDVRGGAFTVHSLTESARVGLEGGRIQRLVAWVFRGGRDPARPTAVGGEDR